MVEGFLILLTLLNIGCNWNKFYVIKHLDTVIYIQCFKVYFFYVSSEQSYDFFFKWTVWILSTDWIHKNYMHDCHLCIPVSLALRCNVIDMSNGKDSSPPSSLFILTYIQFDSQLREEISWHHAEANIITIATDIDILDIDCTVCQQSERIWFHHWQNCSENSRLMILK